MTASALTRPGERDRLIVKIGQIDWVFCFLVCLIAGIGGMMLYSIANGHWEPWAGRQMIRFGVCFALMLGLCLIDIRVWFATAYPVYAVAFILLLAVPVVGEVSLGARRWLNLHFVRIQPSEIMKIGLVLALARYYHGITAQEAKWSWKLVIPALMILLPVGLVAKQPDLGTAILLALTGAAVMILAGLDMRVVAAGILGAVVALPPFVMFVMHGYQRDRMSGESAYKLSAVDQAKDRALGIFAEQAGREELRAIGRYYLDPGGESAEVAFIVHEGTRRGGMAGFLLGELAATAGKRGIKRFWASVLPGNHGMAALFVLWYITPRMIFRNDEEIEARA